ncbi:MAG: sialidase [Acidobacteriota bacterium]
MTLALQASAQPTGSPLPAVVQVTDAATHSAAGRPEAARATQDPLAQLLANFEYRHIGPLGNRVIAVTGVAGDPNVYYVGAASGGIFKTVDGGVHWQPIFDDQPVSSVGALAVAPSDPNVVWAGTGETFIRANISIGNGIYRSDDAGQTWRHMGLGATGRIGRILIHPTDPRIVYAAALGHGYGPQQERGVYRTVDGGDTWQRVLFVGEHSGASDLVMDPTNPRILFAGIWEIHITPWSRQSGGPESSLHMSRDGGDTWTRLAGSGLPEPPWGKIGLTISPDDPRRIYALIETSSNRDFAGVDAFQGVLWRSDDGGTSWTMTSADNTLMQRPLYYTRALAAPDDADEVHFMAVRHSRSLDGGLSSTAENQAGWDHHDIWIDPEIPDRMIVGHDGGISISTTRGATWFKPQLPIAQMYHAHVDNQIPYYVYGNRQDGPSTHGPSNSLTGGTIPIGAWSSVGGCEVGFAVPRPDDHNIVWTGCYDGILERFDARTGHVRDVSVWPDAAESWPAAELEYRFHWTFPIAISPHDPDQVFVGSQYVHRTTDSGQSWTVISPDLTTDDPELQQRTGGLTLDDAGPTVAPSVFALAVSPIDPDLIWAGTNDGQVQLTRGDDSWTNVTANLPDLPPRGTISNIEPSRHDAATAYLTVDRHQLADTATYVFKTEDYGASWRRITGGIPQSVLGYAHCVREDPVRPGLLYLGVENGVYVSFDDGEAWHPLQGNLPHAPVHWLTVQEHFNDLVVATYGRGFWILDDLTPLQQLQLEGGDGIGDAPILFEPRSAYRFHYREAPMMQPEDPAAGDNPAYGASLHIYLGPAEQNGTSSDASDDAPSKATLEILDREGEVVRSLEDFQAERTGSIQRVTWDLQYDKTSRVKLRNRPAENPHVKLPSSGWRRLIDGGQLSVLAPPGVYTARLEVDGVTISRELTVLKDPNATGSSEDLKAQMGVVLELREMVEESVEMINELEWARKRLLDLDARLMDSAFEDQRETRAVLTASRALREKIETLEGHFFDLRLTQASQDTLRWKRLLYSRLIYLARSLQQADHPPTDQQLEVFRMLEKELATHRRSFERLRLRNVPAFNQMLANKGIPNVILGSESPQ